MAPKAPAAGARPRRPRHLRAARTILAHIYAKDLRLSALPRSDDSSPKAVPEGLLQLPLQSSNIEPAVFLSSQLSRLMQS